MRRVFGFLAGIWLSSFGVLHANTYNAYVVNRGNGTVNVVNTSTNMVVGPAISVGNTPAGIAITPDGNYAYVANIGGNTVSVIDTSTNMVTATISGTLSQLNSPIGIAITPDGNYAYVVNAVTSPANGFVSIIDTSTNMVVGSSIPIGPEASFIAITPDGNYAYVPDNGNNNVSVSTSRLIRLQIYLDFIILSA